MAKNYGGSSGFGTKFDSSVHRAATGGNSAPHSMSPKDSKRHFEKHAKKTHALNMVSRLPMRGGIRL